MHAPLIFSEAGQGFPRSPPNRPVQLHLFLNQEDKMNIPADLKFTQNDEWVRMEGSTGTVGITDHAQEQLSDIVFVEIVVSEGDTVRRGDTCATVESVKAAADVYVPISGTVVAVNENLANAPETINSDPYGEAWMIKVEPSDPTELEALMDSAAYQEKIQE
jgi:glycine cleavage system H protein